LIKIATDQIFIYWSNRICYDRPHISKGYPKSKVQGTTAYSLHLITGVRCRSPVAKYAIEI